MDEMNNIPRIEDLLVQEGMVISTTVGVSMYPMLRDRRDTVVIKPPTGRLKKYDVPLYRRGSRYILHRILKVTPEGYIIRGDNCIRKEYDITDEHIIGVLVAFYRGKKQKPVHMNGVGYKLYVRLWRGLYPVRCVWLGIRHLGGRFLRRIGVRN